MLFGSKHALYTQQNVLLFKDSYATFTMLSKNIVWLLQIFSHLQTNNKPLHKLNNS